MDRARIVLADDHQEFLACAVRLLETEFEVLETVSDGESLLEAVKCHQPDIVVVDITMPGLNGIEVARRLKESGSNVKVVFLTMHQDGDYVQAALATGAQGYVIKGRLASDLIPAMRAALAGRSFVSNR